MIKFFIIKRYGKSVLLALFNHFFVLFYLFKFIYYFYIIFPLFFVIKKRIFYWCFFVIFLILKNIVFLEHFLDYFLVYFLYMFLVPIFTRYFWPFFYIFSKPKISPIIIYKCEPISYLFILEKFKTGQNSAIFNYIKNHF